MLTNQVEADGVFAMQRGILHNEFGQLYIEDMSFLFWGWVWLNDDFTLSLKGYYFFESELVLVFGYCFSDFVGSGVWDYLQTDGVFVCLLYASYDVLGRVCI